MPEKIKTGYLYENNDIKKFEYPETASFEHSGNLIRITPKGDSSKRLISNGASASNGLENKMNSVDKSKKPIKQRFIEGIGGRTNGSVDSFLFDWAGVKRIVWVVGVSFSLVVLLSAKINFYRNLPARMNNVEETQKTLIKRADKQDSNIKHIKESIDIMRDDLRTLVMRDK